MKKPLVALLVITFAICTTACSFRAKSNDSKPENAKEALEKLLDGNEKYLSENITPNVDDSLRTDLAKNGQHPYAIVVTCSDSRVPAELIFNAGLEKLK